VRIFTKCIGEFFRSLDLSKFPLDRHDLKVYIMSTVSGDILQFKDLGGSRFNCEKEMGSAWDIELPPADEEIGHFSARTAAALLGRGRPCGLPGQNEGCGSEVAP